MQDLREQITFLNGFKQRKGKNKMNKHNLKDYTERVQLFAQLENISNRDFFFKYTQFTESMKKPFSEKYPDKVAIFRENEIHICDFNLFDEFCKDRLKQLIQQKEG